MPTINELSTTTSLTTSDKMIVYSNDNGDTRKATLSTLISFLQENYQEDCMVTQIVTPTSGSNIVLASQTTDLWLIVSTTSGVVGSPLSSLTITLPPVASLYDSQEVSIGATVGITSLSIGGNGATVFGAPTALQRGGFVSFKYNVEQVAWYATNPGQAASFETVVISQSVLDANNNETIKFGSTANAVNEVTITNAASGGAPSVSATGASASIGLNLVSKGTGTVQANGVDVVTLSGTQTLTSKTLTSPTLNSPVINSAVNATLTTPTLTSPTLNTPSVNNGTISTPTLSGNVSLASNETVSIGSSETSRLNNVWAKESRTNYIYTNYAQIDVSLVAQDALVPGTVESSYFLPTSTLADPPSGEAGAYTQRNSIMANCSVTFPGGIATVGTKKYNVNTITNPLGVAGQWRLNLFEPVSSDCAVVATIGNSTTTSGKSLKIRRAYLSSSTQVEIETEELDLSANTATLKDAAFNVIVIGSPQTDR